MAALTPEAVVRENARLLSVPEIVSRLNDMVEDPNTSAADIANGVSQDPALTARLLKVVNSPYYNFPATINTVSMAITVLGTRQLRDLVMSIVLIKQFSKPTRNEFDVETFWCHSLTCAIGARIIGGELKVANQERFFVAGLLHDIGKMVMHLALPERCRELSKAAKKDPSHLQNIEKRIFGFDHAWLGAELLRHWHLPESIIEPCRFHHHPQQATRFVRESAALHLADAIANNLQAPIAPEDDLLLFDGVWDILGLDQKNLERFHELVYAQMDEVLQVFYYDQAD